MKSNDFKAFIYHDSKTYAARVEKMYSDFAAIEKKCGIALAIATETGGLLKHAYDSARRIYRVVKWADGTP